ncbi:hypothetical protein M231_07266 [Tremella mesenterica]|uniref:F-box domain-containing protein n=1 Tax=Tremella mesenterica TaxID=5217 RepID=A0A4Q1B9M3_TREME|nr:hypothetical protein M231_07266 [Tremella mesenterica]
MNRTNLLDIPTEVMVDILLPLLSARELSNMMICCKRLYSLVTDESLWRLLVQRDFSFSPSTLAKPSDPRWFRHLYRGLSHPRTFLWGSTDSSRLGIITGDPRLGRGVIRNQRYIDSPMEVYVPPEEGGGGTWSDGLRKELGVFRSRITGLGQNVGPTGARLNQSSSGTVGREQGRGDNVIESNEKWKGHGVVELQAGGWSFTARDMNGGVWVWGVLDGLGLIRFSVKNWSQSNCQIPQPTRIPLPCRATSISSGRKHLLILDEDNLIWEFTSYGKAYRHTSPSLTAPTTPGNSSSSIRKHIIQLSTGWNHSACLTSTGKIYIWFPFSSSYISTLTPDDRLDGPLRPLGSDDNDDDRSVRWGTVGDVTTLMDPLPVAPVWIREEERDERVRDRREKLEDEWKEWREGTMRGKKEDGEKVVKIASGLDFVVALKQCGEVWLAKVTEASVGNWQYLPFFSSPHISHITAQFESLTSYSLSSKLNHTRLSFPLSHLSSLLPDPLPTLQEKNVIQVVSGDYHNVALTADGKVFTWGKGDHGELGLGRTEYERMRTVDEPREVDFGEKVFAFGLAAAGWHTGALVLGKNAFMSINDSTENGHKQSSMEENTGDIDGKDGNGTGGTEHEPVEVGGAEEREESGDTVQEERMPGEFPGGNFAVPFRIGFPGRAMDGARMTVERHWRSRNPDSGPSHGT